MGLGYHHPIHQTLGPSHVLSTTLPETNIAPENGWLVLAYFQGRTVSFREGRVGAT